MKIKMGKVYKPYSLKYEDSLGYQCLYIARVDCYNPNTNLKLAQKSL